MATRLTCPHCGGDLELIGHGGLVGRATEEAVRRSKAVARMAATDALEWMDGLPRVKARSARISSAVHAERDRYRTVNDLYDGICDRSFIRSSNIGVVSVRWLAAEIEREFGVRARDQYGNSYSVLDVR